GKAGAAAERAIEAAQKRGLPVFRGHLQPAPEAVAALAGKPVLAFAGIADPEKFFATLEAHDIPATVRRSFPDHHPYSESEITDLVTSAEQRGLTLVTTEKDMARLRGNLAASALVAKAAVLPVALTFDDAAGVKALLHETIIGAARS